MKPVANIKLTFRALRNRNYRLFFFGQGTSLIGTWMQQVAIGWLVYRLTDSPLMLGIVGFVSQIPTFIFTPIAGVLADRHDRRTMLIVTQIFSMVQAAILAALVLTQNIQVWELVALSAFLGIINSFDIPIRQAFTVEMVENKHDLGNAIALNSSMLNAGRLIGPAIAGILIAGFGEGVCFLLNALSYIPILAALCLMSTVPHKPSHHHRHILLELKDGLSYAFHFFPIRMILILLALTSLMGVPFQVLLPIFAKDIFQGGPQVLGFLVAMVGIGALVGALYLAGRKSVIGLGRLLALSAGLFGMGLAFFALSRNLVFSMLMLLVAGFGMMAGTASSNTILQTIVEEDKRGRIMSFYTMAFMGMAPFGSLLAGVLANKIGAPFTLLFGGLCCVAGALMFTIHLPSIREKIRPIYAKKGIIPEVAKGIQSATGFEDVAKG